MQYVSAKKAITSDKLLKNHVCCCLHRQKLGGSFVKLTVSNVSHYLWMVVHEMGSLLVFPAYLNLFNKIWIFGIPASIQYWHTTCCDTILYQSFSPTLLERVSMVASRHSATQLSGQEKCDNNCKNYGKQCLKHQFNVSRRSVVYDNQLQLR